MNVQEVDHEIKRLDREILELEQQRPGPALAAQRGNPKSLAALDSKIKQLQDRKENLQSAKIAIRWETARAAEKEVASIVRESGVEWENLSHALHELESCLGRYNAIRDKAARPLSRVHNIPLPDPQYAVLKAVILAVGLKPNALPFIGEGIASLKDEAPVFGSILAEFDRRSKTSPHAPAKQRPEDQASGVLGLLSSNPPA